MESIIMESGTLSTQLPGVSDEAWSVFVRAMITAPFVAVSESNALGAFELSPRRLADLKLVTNLKRKQSGAGKTIWIARFVPPMTCDRFLRSPLSQYRAFALSMSDYDQKMTDGLISRGDISRAGALAILHKAGPSGITSWNQGPRLPATELLFQRTEGIF